MRDEQNKNRQTEEDRIIDAYLNRIDAEAPDLWDRIEAGLDSEAKDAEEKQKKTSKVKYVIPVLAIAAVLLAAVIATPLLSDSKRHSKEINAGRTTDVSNDGLDAAENSNISDRAEDYVDETADSIPETVQNETANRPTQNTTEAILMNGAGGDSSDVQAEAGHTKSQTDAQENAGCTDLQVSESADMDAWQEMSNIAVTLQITEIVTAEPDAVQKYAAKLLQVSDASGELITGQDIVLQPEEAETFSVGEEVTGTLLRYDSERQAWILNRQQLICKKKIHKKRIPIRILVINRTDSCKISFLHSTIANVRGDQSRNYAAIG